MPAPIAVPINLPLKSGMAFSQPLNHPCNYKPDFKVWDKHIQYLEQICKEVTAALIIAAKEMRSGGPQELSYTFYKDDLVLLEATNLQTTHPKAKLAP